MLSKVPDRVLTLWLPVFGIAGAMLYFATYLYQHALNIPYADDIRDVLLFLTNVSKSQEWTHTAELFFAQMNDHRTLTSRLAYYLALSLQGEANFRTLIFIGNLALPLILLMFYLSIRQQPHALLMLLSATLVLFQLRIYGTSFWAMNAFSFMFVFVYGFASIMCLRTLTPGRFISAIVFAVLATFTLASGQLIWLVGLVCILHQIFILRRVRTTYLVGWIISAVVILAVYRIGYQNPNSITHMLGNIPEWPLEIVMFFLVLAGRAFSDNNTVLAAVSGAVMLLGVLWSTMRNFRGDNMTLDLFAWYIILSLMAITLGRASVAFLANDSGLLSDEISVSDMLTTMEFSPRYAFPSVLLLATTVVLLASQIPNGRKLAMTALIIPGAFAYCVSSYLGYPTGLQEMFYTMVGGHNSKNYWAYGDINNESNAFVEEAVTRGIYHPPMRPLPLPNLGGSPQAQGVRSSAEAPGQGQ